MVPTPTARAACGVARTAPACASRSHAHDSPSAPAAKSGSPITMNGKSGSPNRARQEAMSAASSLA